MKKRLYKYNKDRSLTPVEFTNFVRSTAEKKLHEAVSAFQIDCVRDEMFIGEFVYFKVRNAYFGGELEDVGGIVKAKYKHIFMLEDGRTYKYSNYIIGNNVVYKKTKEIEDAVSTRDFYYTNDSGEEKNYCPSKLEGYSKKVRSAYLKESREMLSGIGNNERKRLLELLST